MSLLLEEDVEDVIEADDWSTIVADTRERQRQELERKVAEFEARGGHIKEFECGETAIGVNQYLWSFPVGKAADPNPAKKAESEGRRKAAQTAAQKRGTDAIRGTKWTDDELVVLIDKNLSVAKNKKGLCDTLGCSDNLLQRLLFQHFRNDKRADPYRAVSRLDHELQQVAQIRKLLAEGQTGFGNISKLLGLKNRESVKRLDQRYGLKIPRNEPGKQAWVLCLNTLCGLKVVGKASYCPRCGTITALGIAGKSK